MRNSYLRVVPEAIALFVLGWDNFEPESQKYVGNAGCTIHFVLADNNTFKFIWESFLSLQVFLFITAPPVIH
jgi:hypothetical protein